MNLKSMTGFARTNGQWRTISWIWEVKSVNGRNLDMRCRLPSGFDALELPLRRKIAEHLSRGSVTASLTLRGQMREASIRINHDILNQLIRLSAGMGKLEGLEPARLDGLLNVAGVVTIEESDLSEEDLGARDLALLSSLDQALAQLTLSREQEGAHLKTVLGQHIDRITQLTGEARQCPAARPEAIRQRFEARIAEFTGNLTGLDPARLAQEAALLATKADTREEFDRLDAHIKSARELLQGAEAVGRRLDFLAQEFNREANTLCSKSVDADLTRIGLDLKATIDQFREQIQNIE